jgi:hypothetical protein
MWDHLGGRNYVMMSLSSIKQMSRERAIEAARERRVPFFVEEEDIEFYRQSYLDGTLSFPFPNLGDHVPDGWELEDSLFVDSSGFGSSGEAALTICQFIEAMEPNFGYAIIEEGQFQVYVGRFKKTLPEF